MLWITCGPTATPRCNDEHPANHGESNQRNLTTADLARSVNRPGPSRRHLISTPSNVRCSNQARASRCTPTRYMHCSSAVVCLTFFKLNLALHQSNEDILNDASKNNVGDGTPGRAFDRDTPTAHFYRWKHAETGGSTSDLGQDRPARRHCRGFKAALIVLDTERGN